tara:strand:- start:589 stop:741 length:153 start_codon:yes stop_codon:yes gene_type:complete
MTLTEHEFKIKQTNDFVRAMEIILRHEDTEELNDLKQYCEHRMKMLKEES